ATSDAQSPLPDGRGSGVHIPDARTSSMRSGVWMVILDRETFGTGGQAASGTLRETFSTGGQAASGTLRETFSTGGQAASGTLRRPLQAASPRYPPSSILHPLSSILNPLPLTDACRTSPAGALPTYPCSRGNRRRRCRRRSGSTARPVDAFPRRDP